MKPCGNEVGGKQARGTLLRLWRYGIDGKPYSEIVDIARKYIQGICGFEKFAEWGLF